MGISLLVWSTACTTIVEQYPDENATPPPDTRPLPQAPEPLPSAMPEVVASGLLEPRGMALFGDRLLLAEAKAGRLLALTLSDGAQEVLGADLGEPWAVAVHGQTPLLSDRAGGRVLAIKQGAAVVLASDQEAPQDLAVHGDYVYWLTAGKKSGSSWVGGAVRRALVDQSGPVEDVIVDLRQPRGLSVSDSHVFVTVAASPSKLLRVALTGGVAEELGSAPEEAYDCARDDGSGEVFWVTRTPAWPYSGWINRTSADGANTTRLVASQAYVSHVAVDAQHVYWAFIDGVHRFRRDGSGVVEPVALAVASGDLLLTNDALFVSDRLSGRVYRRAK